VSAPEIQGWRPGDFDATSRLWWEVTPEDAEVDGVLDEDKVLRLQLCMGDLYRLTEIYRAAGFEVGIQRAAEGFITYAFITTDTKGWIRYRLMNRGEHERIALKTKQPERERRQTAAIAVNRDRTTDTLSRLGAEIQAMKRRAGVA
jgi:hypothetical protein